jgi:hypothetical protein
VNLDVTNYCSDSLHSSNTGESWEYNGTVHQLFIDYEKAYDLVRREVVYNILTEFCIPMNLVMLIKIHLNEAYINVRVGKDLMHFIFRIV